MNLDDLMEQTIDEPLSTRRPALPEGEYEAVITKVNEIREVGDPANPKYILPITWELTDQAVAEFKSNEPDLADAFGDKVTITQDVWLDVKDGRLDTGEGKNVNLGRLRSAANQNEMSGWRVTDLEGAGPCLIRVTQRPDRNDDSVFYNDVKRVTAID